MSELPGGTVTFLFTDIEGSTRLLKQLGERYGEALAEHRRILRDAFAAHGGREVDSQGDSFFVAFGRARDAALAAAAAQRALAAHAWPDGVELRVRMGLHTGEPAVGEDRYVGLGVHRAARIMAAGHGGQILLSQATRAVLADETLPGTAIRDLGEYRLKDLDEPERLYQLGDGEFPPLRTLALDRPLLPAGEIPLPGPLLPTPPFPFVGREPELAVLRAMLERPAGGMVLLAAEAGGGKTRLIRELAHEATGGGTLVCYGASDAAVTTPYQPLREWLEFLLSACDPDVLRACLGGREAQLARLVPELERLTGAAPSEGGEVDRYALHSAVSDLLAQLSRLQPLLLVADDVHWADDETLQLLRRLARKAPETRLVVLAAYREEESGGALGEVLADLSRRDGVTRLSLAGLSGREMEAFVRAAANSEATDELLAAIGELTSGTPLLVCELWRDLLETGAVEVVDTIRLTRPVSELRGPGRLGEIVQQRLSRLASGTAALVELAAVAGARFELRVVGEAAGLDLSALLAAIDEVAATGIVEELPDPTPACRFTHELVRRAVYDRVKPFRRAELHLRVGEALERVYAADPARVLPELAYHFTLAAPLAGVERGVDYNLRAADAATAAGAYGEGAARLSAALELGIDDPRDRARVQIELAHIHRNAGHWPEAQALVAASLETAEGLEERDLTARALVSRAWMELFDPTVDPEDVRAVAADAIGPLAAAADARGLAEAWRLLAFTLSNQGRQTEASAAFEQVLLSADESNDRGMARLASAGIASMAVYGPMPAEEAIVRCEELIRSSPADRKALITRYLAVLNAMVGRFDEARELVAQSNRVLDEGDHIATWATRDAAGQAMELYGDRAGAEEAFRTMWLKAAEVRGGALDHRAMRAAYQLAHLYCDEGRWEDAERCVAYGAEAPVPSFYTSQAVWRLAARARLTAHLGKLDEALALGRRAVELADRSDIPNLRARVWLALAEAERASGNAAEGDAAVAAALALYEQKGNVAAAAAVRARAGRSAGVGV